MSEQGPYQGIAVHGTTTNVGFVWKPGEATVDIIVGDQPRAGDAPTVTVTRDGLLKALHTLERATA